MIFYSPQDKDTNNFDCLDIFQAKKEGIIRAL